MSYDSGRLYRALAVIGRHGPTITCTNSRSNFLWIGLIDVDFKGRETTTSANGIVRLVDPSPLTPADVAALEREGWFYDENVGMFYQSRRDGSL